MTFTEAVTAHLLASAPVVALAGSRINWTRRAQGDRGNAIRMQRVGGERPRHLKGFQDGRPTRVQFDCFAATYADAVAMAEAVTAAFDQPVTVGGVRMVLQEASDPLDLGDDTKDGFLHRQSVDLTIWHNG